MRPLVNSDRLACGTPIDAVLSQVADGAPAADPQHQRSCPHCRAALAEIASLWEPLQTLRAEQVAAPPDLRSAVMAKVRSLPRNPWYAIVPGDRGATLTAARVFAHVVGLASRRVPGVTLAVGGGRAPAGADIGVAGRHVVVDVHVVVQLGAHIPTLARLLRARIREHVVSMTGMTPAEINVNVIDVAD